MARNGRSFPRWSGCCNSSTPFPRHCRRASMNSSSARSETRAAKPWVNSGRSPRQRFGTTHNRMMSATDTSGARLTRLDDATRSLVRLAAALAGGSEEQVRGHLQEALASTTPVWIEELLLQTYLFAGFPPALNGMPEWRRMHPAHPPPK